jgi:phosphoglycolate phosphatase-like HAD superfamily hydrolase
MVRPFPGARETLRRVDEEGGNVVLVSSSSGRDLEFLVGTIGCEDIIRDVVHGDMADASKPSPDLFSLALERSGTAPEDVLALGDAIWDVNAAASAGIDCVALESGGTDQSRLQWAGALAVYRGCSELLGRWATSPIADLLRSGHRKTAYSNLNAWPTTSRIRIR